MKVKKVNRYYCEFCKKAGCSGGHIRKHEERCTANPNRVCGICAMLGLEQKPIADLIALLPKMPEGYTAYTAMEEAREYRESGAKETAYYLAPEIAKALPALRELTGNCPACILAAFRQAKIFVSWVEGFDFKSECEAVWQAFNEKEAAKAGY